MTSANGGDRVTTVEAAQPDQRREGSGVLLVGFKPLYGRVLRDALGLSGRFSTVRGGVRAPDAFDALATYRPRVVIVAWESINALALRRMSTEHPDTAIVVLAHPLTTEQARVLVRCGAVAVLDRRRCRHVLVETVVLACQGMEVQHRSLTPEPHGASGWEKRLARLSSRETEILGLLDCGESTATIAELLGVSRHTVKAQTQAIYRKLEVHSRAELHARRLRPTGEAEPRRDAEGDAAVVRLDLVRRARRRPVPGWVRAPLRGGRH